jgi:hypothetical protein
LTKSVINPSGRREGGLVLAHVDYYLPSWRQEEREGGDSRSYIYTDHLRYHLSSSSLSPAVEILFPSLSIALPRPMEEGYIFLKVCGVDQ